MVRHSIIHRALYDYFKYADLAEKIVSTKYSECYLRKQDHIYNGYFHIIGLN